MKVKVKYQETIERNTTIDIDDDEFLAYINEAAPEDDQYGSIQEFQTEQGETFNDTVKEYLEDGEDDEWAVANDPRGLTTAFDQELLEVEVL